MRTIVPCNGCTGCCWHGAALHPEKGDDPAKYDAVWQELDQRFALRQRDDGACIYLGKHGCTIYDRAPYICRIWDCREYVKSLDDHAQQFIRDPQVAAGLRLLSNPAQKGTSP